jgi:hypothetical protein
MRIAFLPNVLVLLFTLCPAVVESTQQIPLGDSQTLNPLTKDFEKLVNRTLEEWHVPGVITRLSATSTAVRLLMRRAGCHRCGGWRQRLG